MHSPLYRLLIKEMNLSEEDIQVQTSQRQEILDAQAIADFLMTSEKLMICGDYDCDGIMATAIACQVASDLKIPYGYYIPNRLTEGYGASAQTIHNAYNKGYTDILMVDNGVKAFDAISLAKELGMRIAIIDHHNYDEDLDVDAFLHPKLCTDYFKDMSAGGLMACVAEYMGLLSPQLLAMGAVATIGDVMPLWNKNRELVKRAIKVLEEERILAFDLLVKRNKFTHYSASMIAFQIVPKINSIGRLSDIANVNTAVQYFLSDDVKILKSYSEQVFKLNNLRKDKSQLLKEDALKKVNGECVEIITGEDYHEGLVGIVANQLTSLTQKPSIVLADYKTHLKGSARSNTISLKDLFEKLDSRYFIAMGGHDFAYGMTLDAKYFEDFKEEVNRLAIDLPNLKTEKSCVKIPLEYLSLEGIHEVKSLEPFGTGFDLPLMEIDISMNYKLVRLGSFGYKFVFSEGPLQEAVYFNMSQNLENMSIRTLVGKIDLDQYPKIAFSVDEIKL